MGQHKAKNKLLDPLKLLAPPLASRVSSSKKHIANTFLKTENILLRQILAESPNPIRVTTAKNEILYVNPAWEKLTGYSFEEVEGKKASFLNSRKTPPIVYKKLEQALKQQIPFTTEEIIDKRKDGTLYQLYATMYTIHIDNTILYVQTHYDITSRKQREELEHQLASLVKFSNDAILGISLDQKFTSWNPAAKKMYGYSEKEVLGKPISLIIPPHLQGEEKRILLENPVFSYETFRQSKSKQLINVLITVSPIKNDRGQIIGYSAIHHDITEHREISKKLNESNRRFKAVFNSMFQFIGLLSPNGQLLEANDTALSFINAQQKDVAGKFFWDTPWWNFSSEVKRQIKSSIKQASKGEFIRIEANSKNPMHDVITLDFSLTPVKNDKGKIVLLIAEGRDITYRKILEQQKSAFLSIASHELKTPITTLKLMFEIFIRRSKKAVKEVKELNIINRELDRLVSLINDLLDISRIESGKMHLEMTNTDLTDLINQVRIKMKLLTGKRKIVVIKAPKCIVFCDAKRIEEVLTNLIANAIKYSADGTTIFVRLKINKNNVVVSVKDHGIGISKEDTPHIFERYYQAHERGSGFGLGLYITKEIITKHKGKIWVKSTPGKGSTFTFSLPLIS